ncbi:amidase [Allohahella marinimesophila]|uniref:Amidase n=1 Tax=Allohahella marinimesophila TaxID=1054972 RepID=A0ABP7P4E1_9GAMM
MAPHEVKLFSKDALGTDDCTGLLERLADEHISADELFKAAHERLQLARALNADICAVPLQTDLARDALPFAIKDNTNIAGLPTTHGSLAFSGGPARRDAPIVEEFAVAGFRPIAKTTLPEFGLTATTEYSRAGRHDNLGRSHTANPWHTDHIAGGSSGGSAALVAAGVVPAAHANDGGGSIRIPAACCGLIGLKPSHGRLTLPFLAKNLPLQIVTEGVLTRSVRDTALIFAALEQKRSMSAVLASAEPGKRRSQHDDGHGLRPIGHVFGHGGKRLRIAMFTRRPDDELADEACVDSVQNIAKVCRELGHRVSHIDNPATAAFGHDFLLYWSMLAASVRLAGTAPARRLSAHRNPLQMPDFTASRLEPMTNALAMHFMRRFWRLPGSMRALRRFSASYRNLFSDYDLLLCPTLGQVVPKAGHLAPDLPWSTLESRLRKFACFTPADNIAGTPAISLPVAQDENGLPVGVQFSADIGHEEDLLSLALELDASGALLDNTPTLASAPPQRDNRAHLS